MPQAERPVQGQVAIGAWVNVANSVLSREYGCLRASVVQGNANLDPADVGDTFGKLYQQRTERRVTL